MPISIGDELIIKCQRFCCETFIESIYTEYVNEGSWVLFNEQKEGRAFSRAFGVRLCI